MTPASADSALLSMVRTLFVGMLGIAMAVITLVGPAPAASAATTLVNSEKQLRDQLLAQTGSLTLGTSFTVSGGDLTVSADTTLLLAGFMLTTKNIIVSSGTTLTIGGPGDSGTLTVRAENGPGITTTNAALIINSGTIFVTSSGGHAGIGGEAGASGTGGAGGNGGSTTINGGDVTVLGGGSGIGGGIGGNSTGPSVPGGDGGDGGTTIVNGGVVRVVGEYGAGIGGGSGGSSQDRRGGDGGNGGNISITGGQVDATGHVGAGIGGGQGGVTIGWTGGGNGGNGGNISITGGQVDATGYDGAGIGGGRGGGAVVGIGGYGGDGGTVTVEAGRLTAAANHGAGIGGGDGGYAPPPEKTGHTRGLGGDASIFSIGVSASVEASRDLESANGTAIGPGGGLATGDYLPMSVNGELTLPAGQRLWIQGATEFRSASPITGTGTITGEGTIQNDGVITPQVHDDVTVTGNNHYVTFDSGTSQVDPRIDVVRVLAPTFAAGARNFPADPVIAGNPFSDWNTNADGSGTTPTETTVLSGNPTFYGQWTHDTYEFSADATDPHVGDPITFAVAVEDGDPAGDQSAAFTFSTNTSGAAFDENTGTFTRPGTWTVTATHKSTPSVVLTIPITVTTDRTAADKIALTLSTTTLDVDGTITATVTGTDAWGNPLGELTDLATISSDESGDTVTQGSTPASIHFATPGIRTITASIGSVTDTVDVTVASEDYTIVADVTSPLAGDEITFSITADDGNPAGNLASEFSFETTGPGTTTTGNPVTLTTAGTWTVTATHTTSGTQVTLPLTVGTDRTTPAAITLNLSSASVGIGGTVTATVTGADAWGNPLGDLTDLATITSDHPNDVIDASGSIRFPTASPHVITATIGSVSHSITVTVIPAALPDDLAATGGEPLPLVLALVVAGALLLLLGGFLTARHQRRS